MRGKGWEGDNPYLKNNHLGDGQAWERHCNDYLNKKKIIPLTDKLFRINRRYKTLQL